MDGGYHRLDRQQLPHRTGRRGDTAAATQVLERVEQPQHAYTIAHALHIARDLKRRGTLGRTLERILNEHALAERDVIGVDDEDVAARGLREGGLGALVRSRELGADRDDHGIVALLAHRLYGLGKLKWVHLPCLGKRVALDKQLVKALARKVHAVLVDVLPKGDGERQNG